MIWLILQLWGNTASHYVYPCNTWHLEPGRGKRKLPKFKNKETKPKKVNIFLVNGIECVVCGILGEEEISLLLTSAIKVGQVFKYTREFDRTLLVERLE